MWLTPEQVGISQSEVDVIVERLWQEALNESGQLCPDCNANVGEQHNFMCDVARCTNCGGQFLSCGCSNAEPDNWTGIWPGMKKAYENKFICMWSKNKEWIFDLNRLYTTQE